MRKKAWIPLILLTLGSLLVNRGLSSIPLLPESSVARESGPHQPLATTSTQKVAAAVAPGPPLDPSGSGSPTPDRLPPHSDVDLAKTSDDAVSREPERTSLDFAPSEEIQRVLGAAIEKRRQDLFVTPGIVETMASERNVRIIFETGPEPSRIDAAAVLAGETGMARFASLRIFPLFDRGAAEVGPEALLHLIENPTTSHIELDEVHRTSLNETIPLIQADLARRLEHDGDGFAVAILDTGVDPTHPMFADRIIEEACFSVGNDCPNGQSQMLGPGAAIPCPISGCGHGTRVAGIALGNDPNGNLIGAAPHADLIAVQIFSDVNGEPGAYASDILAGLQHVLGLSTFHSIASVNMSFGGSPFTSETSCDRSVSSQFNAVSLLRAAGIVVVAASGNEYLTNAITTPACLSNVVAVGSTSDNDVVSSFSNSADFLRLLAPGELVETASLGGGTRLASGTSMATPHVAGAIAAIREAVPDASADEIDNALVLSGRPILDTRNGITTPRIRVLDTIDLLETTMVPSAGSGGSQPSGGTASGSPAATASSGGGGGGGCGLVGLEPFLILGMIRIGRRCARSGIGRMG